MDLADAPPSRLRELVRKLRQRGPLRAAAERARHQWKRATDGRTAVYERRPATPAKADAPALPDGLWIGRYARPEEAPAEFYGQAEVAQARAALDSILDEFLSAGVLWVPWYFGCAAGYQWSRRSDHSSDRTRPGQPDLGPETTHISSFVTFGAYRGRGIAGATLAEICRREVATNGRAVGECFAWNEAAVRTFEAAGFRRVAVRPTRDRSHPGAAR
jgi:ribosomal protein S18 acetylase RimI-like enzyme